ncbi:MAG: hypothetical protein E7A62_03855 [Actinomycetaceae bacterium]|nr:hypothetical protein [Actinomycetaceae bacterium]MDU0970120.1 hypothetical protein [Actinomycetaceae bacterium]
MTTMPHVAACAETDCAFNHDGCAAFAMTMGAGGCTTFIALDAHGGLPTVDAQVGACSRKDCTYNDSLVCSAPNVSIGSSHADCLTFKKA